MTRLASGVNMPGQRRWQHGPPSVLARAEAVGFTAAFPDGGGYPKGFLPWSYRTLEALGGGHVDPHQVLHLCGGSVRSGVTVDIRPEMKPTILADCRAVPLPDQSQRWVLADPPYSVEYATNLYGTGDDYPKPAQIMAEAAKLLMPGGMFALLHFQVPKPPRRCPLDLIRVFGITQGGGYAIRAWSVWRKHQEGMT